METRKAWIDRRWSQAHAAFQRLNATAFRFHDYERMRLLAERMGRVTRRAKRMIDAKVSQ